MFLKNTIECTVLLSDVTVLLVITSRYPKWGAKPHHEFVVKTFTFFFLDFVDIVLFIFVGEYMQEYSKSMVPNLFYSTLLL